ncbi:uncharacterized protein LOC112454954, partial [Temnothorax curvispinosus]|uniref:Uncharacterized protein LOC112454954 n=1 Tax=Temnothorax curvispinosus TaxID=300111 RepID=A0A6J1PSZ6_9HYME
MDLQDIFYAIPDCDVVIRNEDPYEKIKKVLTDYFRPKLNTTYERHLFRNMAQKEDETVACSPNAPKHGDGSDKRDKKEAKTNSSANKEERKSTTVKQLDGDAADRDDDEYTFALRDKICVLEHGEINQIENIICDVKLDNKLFEGIGKLKDFQSSKAMPVLDQGVMLFTRRISSTTMVVILDLWGGVGGYVGLLPTKTSTTISQPSETLTQKNLYTLADSNWLNDEVINFYMNLLIARGTSSDAYLKVHAMNTFFYPKLLSGGHSSLKQWTRKVNIFAQDLVVVPVHLDVYWCMAIIDFRDKTIVYYSMGSNNSKCLTALKLYLQNESLDKKKQLYDMSDWEFYSAKNIPQQTNGSDC